MITSYKSHAGCITPLPEATPNQSAIWIDLVEPTAAEDTAVEEASGVAIPTRDEAREIEASSRLYRENGAYYMTAFALYNAETEMPAGATLTFVLAGERLITVRYHKPRAFPIFCGRAAKGEVACATASEILLGLLETIVERAADLIERIQDRVEVLARDVFDGKRESRTYERRLDVVLKSIGRQGDIIARLEESAFSIERLLTFLGAALKERGEPAALAARGKAILRDVRSLTQQMQFLAERITFLLDATLGAISIQQNQTMKLFSLLAVTLMPPTLIGSIYGMNFKHIPELEWLWGYPMALVLMLASGVIPFLYFRSKGWF